MVSVLKQIATYACFIALSACSAVDRIENIGKPPDMAPIVNPAAQPGYQPVSMPKEQGLMGPHLSNSLSTPGSRRPTMTRS